MKKLCCFFLFFIFTFNVFSAQKMNSVSALFSREVDDPSKIPDDYFTTFSDTYEKNMLKKLKAGECYTWTECTFDLDDYDSTMYLQFLYSQVKEIKVYCRSENGSWIFVGTTGDYISRDERSFPGIVYAVGLSPRNLNAKNVVRIRGEILSDSRLKVRLLSRAEFVRNYDFKLVLYSLFFGIEILALFLFLFFMIPMSSPILPYSAVLCIASILFVFFESNMHSLFELPISSHVNTFYNMNGALFITSAISWYFKENVQFKFFYHTKERNKVNVIFLFAYFTAMLFILLLPYSFEMFITVSFTVVLLCILIISLHVRKIFIDPEKKVVYSLIHIFFFFVILVKVVFTIMEYTYHYIPLFSLFDYDMDIPFLMLIVFLSMDSIYSLGIQYVSKSRKKTKIVSDLNDEIASVEVQKNAFNIVTRNINRSLEVIREDLEERIETDKSYYKVLKGIDFVDIHNRILSFITHNRNGEYESGSDVIYLLPFMNRILDFSKIMLSYKNCEVINQVKIDGKICVKTEQSIFEPLLHLFLITVDTNSNSNSQINVKTAFSNGYFTFSITFDCNPPKEEELQTLLSFKLENLEDNILAQSWGPNIYLMNYLTKTLNGSFSVLPAKNGLTFSVQLFLQSSLFYPKLFRDDKNDTEQRVLELPSYTGLEKTVLIADSNIAWRIALSDRFHKYFNVVAVNNGQEAFEKLFVENIDAIVVSESLSVMDLKSFIEAVKKNHDFQCIPIFVISSFATTEEILYFKEMGVVDVCDNPLGNDSFLLTVKNTVNLLANNKPVESVEKKSVPKVTKKKEIEGLTNAQNSEFDKAGLTKKEKQIALYISKGMSDKEISELTGISAATVAVHNRNIFKKLGIHKRNELIR